MDPEKKKAPLVLRLLVGLLVPLIIVFLLIYIYKFGSPLFCVFYKATGLYCQGCGSGRALTSLLHLRILDSLHNNLLFLPLSVLILWYFLHTYLLFVTGRNLLPMFSISRDFILVLFIIVLVFIVLRNIRIFPFTLLAPI